MTGDLKHFKKTSRKLQERFHEHQSFDCTYGNRRQLKHAMMKFASLLLFFSCCWSCLITSNAFTITTTTKTNFAKAPFSANKSLSQKQIIGQHDTHNIRRKSSALNLSPSILLDAATTATVTTTTTLVDATTSITSSLSLSLSPNNPLIMTRETSEALAGPFFGASLFPYLAFLYFLNVEENQTPKGVTVGFATCLLFVFLSIPAAIAAQVLYGVSLADSDWLHGSAESLLTVTNLVTVIAFRQALDAKDKNLPEPQSSLEYKPMIDLVVVLTVLAGVTAFVPAIMGPEVHTPYLNGFLDLPQGFWESLTGRQEPENALTVPCWIIHISSLVEFLVAMGFAWRWADVVDNPKWKGLTWGLLPLHSSGITACTYHVFYNGIPVLVPLQAFLTCVGNCTAAWASYRIAVSNGWKAPWMKDNDNDTVTSLTSSENTQQEESQSLIGFEDLGDALANDNDYTFLLKLFLGCTLASYTVKYGEVLFDFPFEPSVELGFLVVFVPSALNAFKWYKRSQDPTFEGWF